MNKPIATLPERAKRLRSQCAHWAGNVVIACGAAMTMATAAAVLVAFVLVMGAAGRQFIRWAEYYPK